MSTPSAFRSCTQPVRAHELALADSGCVEPLQAKTSNFVKDLIWGEGRTTTVLTFRSKASGRQYDVEVLRHIAIKSWDTHRQWLTLKEEFSGRTLSADPQACARSPPRAPTPPACARRMAPPAPPHPAAHLRRVAADCGDAGEDPRGAVRHRRLRQGHDAIRRRSPAPHHGLASRHHAPRHPGASGRSRAARCAGMTTRLGLKFYLEMAGKHPRCPPLRARPHLLSAARARAWTGAASGAADADAARGRVGQAVRDRSDHTRRPRRHLRATQSRRRGLRPARPARPTRPLRSRPREEQGVTRRRGALGADPRGRRGGGAGD